MIKQRIVFSVAAFFAICLFSSFDCFAQVATPVRKIEPSFDIVLQTVIASNNDGKSDVPTSLSSIVRKLKIDFSFSNFRIASTSIQRIANKGGASSKSVSYLSDKNLAVFSEWTIDNLESTADENGQETVQIQSFRFGQRIPINNTTNYEQVGINARFSLPKNAPIIVGSLPTSNPDDLMFVILTIRATEK